MKLRTLSVEAMGQTYPLHIGEGLLGEAARHLAAYRGRKCVVVTDSNVAPLYGQAMLAQLEAAGVDAALAQIRPGEQSKSLSVLARLYSDFYEHRLTRADFLIALGGGVVGDVCGFAAATYLRGIPFVQVPTTLLGQVDSSVGGKVAVNLREGKNLAGAFYQPQLVLIDVATLRTLPEREHRSGMAEVIKYGLIADEALFEELEGGAGDVAALVERCCRIKADYVKRDPTEKGARIELNFGHTLAHALEKEQGYGALAHGEAVAIGIAAASRWGEAMGVTPQGTARRVDALLARCELPASAPLNVPAAVEDMLGDKKAAGGGVRAVLLTRVGRACVREIGREELTALTEGLGWR